MANRTYYEVNPCLNCTRVPDPQLCDNKRCMPWRNWFFGRWAMIHGWYRRAKAKGEVANGLEK